MLLTCSTSAGGSVVVTFDAAFASFTETPGPSHTHDMSLFVPSIRGRARGGGQSIHPGTTCVITHASPIVGKTFELNKHNKQ